MFRIKLFVAILLVSLLVAGCSDSPESSSGASPKVILIIGDGMDDQQITIARTYLAGSRGWLTLDSLPYRGAVRVVAVADDDPDRFVYVSDSSNTATAMATGSLTSPLRVGTTAWSDNDLTNIMELASRAGIGTGVVTTASVTDATPASFMAHVNHRWCQGPDSMNRESELRLMTYDCTARRKSNGGAGSIAEQIADSKMDVVLGGGFEHFDQAVGGDADWTVLNLASQNGYRLIENRDGLLAGADGSRVLGLFTPDTMPVRLRGVDGAKAELLTKEDGNPVMPEPFGCEQNPEFGNTPTLAEMTSFALDSLAAKDGFMLMIESASIDKQSHARRPCGHIGELAQLEAALDLALNFAESHPETLIMVTADHSQIAQIVRESSLFGGLGYGSPGYVARVNTPEGGLLGINYAGTEFPRQDVHTGAQVPVFAAGPGIDELPTLLEQTDIFRIMSNHLGLADTQE